MDMEYGMDETFFSFLTVFWTHVIMLNSKPPLVLRKNAVSLVKIINKLYKERTNDGSKTELKGPEVAIGKLLIEEKFFPLSLADQERYLRGE